MKFVTEIWHPNSKYLNNYKFFPFRLYKCIKVYQNITIYYDEI